MEINQGAVISVEFSDIGSEVCDMEKGISGKWGVEIIQGAGISMDFSDMGSEVCDMEMGFSGNWGVEIIQGAGISVDFSDMGSEVCDMEIGFSGEWGMEITRGASISEDSGVFVGSGGPNEGSEVLAYEGNGDVGVLAEIDLEECRLKCKGWLREEVETSGKAWDWHCRGNRPQCCWLKA